MHKEKRGLAPHEPSRIRCYSLRMRYWGAFVLGLLLLAGQYSIGAPQTATENSGEKLDGEWELVGFKYGPGPRQTVAANRREIKLISGTHFVWVVYETKKQKPIG